MILFALALHLATHPLPPATVSGYPTITDGNTIRVGPDRIRFAATDSPESGQLCTDAAGRPYAAGTEATQHFIELIHGRPVTCSSDGAPKI